MAPVFEAIDVKVIIGISAMISTLISTLIGGGFTYFVTRQNHNNEIERDQLKRRRELLEEVCKNVETFNKTLLKYRAKHNDRINYLQSGEQPPDDLCNELIKLETDVPSVFNEIISAKTKLLLLNEIECRNSLRSIADYSKKFTSKISGADVNTIASELPKFRDGLLDRSEKFFELLGKAYSRKKT